MGSYKSMGESGWTYYIQDDHSNFSSDFESPSLVSDAGTSKKKLAKGSKGNQNASGARPLNQNSSFKQRDNFDLEDTASSPLTSPKELPRQNHPFSYQLSAVKKKASRHY